MVPPDERFAMKDISGLHLNVTADSAELACAPAFQDKANVLADFDSGGQVYAVFSYNACPIPLPEKLETTRLKHREPIEIRIEKTTRGLLYPAKHSEAGLLVGISYCVDCGTNNSENVTLAPNYAENVTWIFEKADMQFETGSKRYRTLKPEATIHFVNGQVELEGIEVKAIDGHQPDIEDTDEETEATEFPTTGTRWQNAKQVLPGTMIASMDNSPLKIVTKGEDMGYYVKVIDWVTQNTELAYFIRGSETLNVKIPTGSYEIRYAIGTKWFGEKELFGPDTKYYTTRKALHFSRVRGYTIELVPQVGGNLPTPQLPRSEW